MFCIFKVVQQVHIGLLHVCICIMVACNWCELAYLDSVSVDLSVKLLLHLSVIQPVNQPANHMTVITICMSLCCISKWLPFTCHTNVLLPSTCTQAVINCQCRSVLAILMYCRGCVSLPFAHLVKYLFTLCVSFYLVSLFFIVHLFIWMKYCLWPVLERSVPFMMSSAL